MSIDTTSGTHGKQRKNISESIILYNKEVQAECRNIIEKYTNKII